MSTIDPERHADLIDAQRRVYAAWEELEAYSATLPRDTSPEQAARLGKLREAARQAAEAKDAALHASGLVEEHGYYVPAQELKQAAKA